MTRPKLSSAEIRTLSLGAINLLAYMRLDKCLNLNYALALWREPHFFQICP
jgi:hypothetical protein